mmetsp:Transcript_45174/g.98304  ORF Transcript_45174/g.98304 Transcript_45174/m.98304 type:complete len:107 (+) Transcript_45174:37-357(+)
MDWEVSAWPYEEVTLCEIWKIRTATVTSLGEEGWSFTSLLQRARQLARRLHTVAPAPGCVGLGLDEGIPMVLLHVAVLEAGMFFLPLDLRQPLARLESMLVTAGCR